MLQEFGLINTNAKSVVPGQRFGKLTVVATGQIPGTYRYKAICKCDCGSDIFAVRFDALTSNATEGCGCVRLERTITHGLSKHPFYDRWKNILARCLDPDCLAYPNYGGRGIKVCDRWRDFRNFVDDMPDGFWRGAHLDRIDNNGHYEPNNVRWASAATNYGNRRSARIIECFGRTQSLTDWAKEVKIDRRIIHARLKSGWSPERALSEPIRKVSKPKG